jgi:hypothetical protein
MRSLHPQNHPLPASPKFASIIKSAQPSPVKGEGNHPATTRFTISGSVSITLRYARVAGGGM